MFVLTALRMVALLSTLLSLQLKIMPRFCHLLSLSRSLFLNFQGSSLFLSQCHSLARLLAELTWFIFQRKGVDKDSWGCNVKICSWSIHHINSKLHCFHHDLTDDLGGWQLHAYNHSHIHNFINCLQYCMVNWRLAIFKFNAWWLSDELTSQHRLSQHMVIPSCAWAPLVNYMIVLIRYCLLSLHAWDALQAKIIIPGSCWLHSPHQSLKCRQRISALANLACLLQLACHRLPTVSWKRHRPGIFSWR